MENIFQKSPKIHQKLEITQFNSHKIFVNFREFFTIFSDFFQSKKSIFPPAANRWRRRSKFSKFPAKKSLTRCLSSCDGRFAYSMFHRSVRNRNPNFPSDVDLFGSQMARSVGRPVASRGFSPVRPIRVVSVGAPAATATVPRNFCSKLCQLSSESDNAACNRAPGWQMKRCRHQKLSFFFQKQCCTIYKQKKRVKMFQHSTKLSWTFQQKSRGQLQHFFVTRNKG